MVMVPDLHAPSWLTIQGPTGVRGVQVLSNNLQSTGDAIPLRILSQIHAACFFVGFISTPNFSGRRIERILPLF
jgi:hypothetical protein